MNNNSKSMYKFILSFVVLSSLVWVMAGKPGLDNTKLLSNKERTEQTESSVTEEQNTVSDEKVESNKTDKAEQSQTVDVKDSDTDYSQYDIYSTKDISIRYPQKWMIKEGFMGTTVMFISPKESENDDFVENMSVATEDLSQYKGLTIQQYTDISLKNIEKIFTDYKLIGVKDTTLSGAPAKQVEYTIKQGQLDLHMYQVISIIDGKGYVLTFTSPKDNPAKFEQERKAMVSSFRVK